MRLEVRTEDPVDAREHRHGAEDVGDQHEPRRTVPPHERQTDERREARDPRDGRRRQVVDRLVDDHRGQALERARRSIASARIANSDVAHGGEKPPGGWANAHARAIAAGTATTTSSTASLHVPAIRASVIATPIAEQQQAGRQRVGVAREHEAAGRIGRQAGRRGPGATARSDEARGDDQQADRPEQQRPEDQRRRRRRGTGHRDEEARTTADAQPMPGSRRIAAAAASASPPAATTIFQPDPMSPTDFAALFSEPLPGFVTAPATDDSRSDQQRRRDQDQQQSGRHAEHRRQPRPLAHTHRREAEQDGQYERDVAVRREPVVVEDRLGQREHEHCQPDQRQQPDDGRAPRPRQPEADRA